MATVAEKARDGGLDRLHPARQLTLVEFDLAALGEGLEDILGARGLEVISDRSVEARLVLADHPPHALKLIDTPLV